MSNLKRYGRKVFTNPLYFIAFGFGSGLANKAPGTAGTIAAIPVFLLLAQLPVVYYVSVVTVCLLAGVFVCDWVAKDMAVKDPGAIVWDEFVGLWVALFLLPEGWVWLLVGFGLFRFFDILKPWPVSFLDRELAGGMGIMMDDVAAGLYSLLVIQGAYFLIASVLS